MMVLTTNVCSILNQGSCNTGALDTVCLHYIVHCDTHYVKMKKIIKTFGQSFGILDIVMLWREQSEKKRVVQFVKCLLAWCSAWCHPFYSRPLFEFFLHKEGTNFMEQHIYIHIIEKSRCGRFLWNRNWDLGWIWAGFATFEAGFFMFSWAKKKA